MVDKFLFSVSSSEKWGGGPNGLLKAPSNHNIQGLWLICHGSLQLRMALDLCQIYIASKWRDKQLRSQRLWVNRQALVG